jgi:NADP-dependent aldehyde dehydrogenase
MLSDPTAPVPDTTPEGVDAAVATAATAFERWQHASASDRAGVLRAIARSLREDHDDLVASADVETGLGSERLAGELRQTSVDLETTADAVEAGAADVSIVVDGDASAPRMVKREVPLGVAANFAAGNFPFAFSVVGVDTSSALAAGCTVVVKAHPGHPRTSEATFASARRALTEGGFPGILQLVHGTQAGIRLLQHPDVKVATFTGSVRGGRALAAVAAARTHPIPFYGELGSINPVLVTPGATAEGRDRLAAEFVEVITDSGGQVCTKPGLLFVPRGDAIIASIAEHAEAVPRHRLLYPALGEQYSARRESVLGLSSVRTIVEGAVTRDGGHVWATPTIAAIDVADAAAAGEAVSDEVFGPMSLVVEYDDLGEALTAVQRLVHGSLTASVHTGSDDAATRERAVAVLERLAGRVVIDGWPMAVYRTAAQHHGGPSPSTTLDVPAATSVGLSALGRFRRSVVRQEAIIEK